MAKVNQLISLALIAICFIGLITAKECPSSTKVLTCTPKCVSDSECSSIGGKCCPNLCNSKSCVQPNQLDNNDRGSSSAFNKNSGGGAGTYCGNVKCSSFEKCDNDRSTKRPKCVRA